LRRIHGHVTTALLELGGIGDPVEIAIPGVQIVLEDLLGCLCGQVGEPFPAGKGVDASVAELSVHLGCGGTFGDATTAAGVPLVQEVPKRPSGMSLSLKCGGLNRKRV
jgi:hypothetical protein